MLTKEKVIQSMKELPNEFSLDEIVEKLIFLEKIEIGIKQTQEGKTVSHEKAKEKFKKWLK